MRPGGGSTTGVRVAAAHARALTPRSRSASWETASRPAVDRLERASHLGGRAATRERSGFCFNEGAHALYRTTALRILRGLGVEPRGKGPPADAIAVRGGELYALPSTPFALLSTRLLSWSS